MRNCVRLFRQQTKPLDGVRDADRTEESTYPGSSATFGFTVYVHPNTMGAAEVETFLTHLAVEGMVAVSARNQALGALLFLYRDVFGKDLQLGLRGQNGCRPC